MKKWVAVLLAFVMAVMLCAPAFAIATWTIYTTSVYWANTGTFSDGSTQKTKVDSTTISTGDMGYVPLVVPSYSLYKAGFIFMGWRYCQSSDVQAGKFLPNLTATTYAGQRIMQSSDFTMYYAAAWREISYRITYYPLGGTTLAGQTKMYTQALQLTDARPTRTGYDFLGWDTDASADAVIYNPGDSYTVNADLSLYAVWSPHTYPITYDGMGGTGAPATQTKTHDVTLLIPDQRPTRDGFTFAGWATDARALAAQYLPGDALPDQALALRALWRMVLPANAASVMGDARSEGGQTIAQDIYLNASETVSSFSVTLRYPDLLTYKSVTAPGLEPSIYASERTDGSGRMLELSCVIPQGFSTNGTMLLCRVELEVAAQSARPFGSYPISVDADSFLMNMSGTRVGLTQTGSQAFEYLPYLAKAIQIVAPDVVTAPTTLSVSFTPTTTTQQTVEWSTVSGGAATIDSSGLLTPTRNGSVTVIAKTTDGSNLNTSTDITVEGQPATLSGITCQTDCKWAAPFSKATRNYIIYVPLQTQSVSFSCHFNAGTLLCDGFGYMFTGVARTFDMPEDALTLSLTYTLTDYDDAAYSISFFKMALDAEITAQPQNARVANTGSVSFTVSASGTGLGYQWQTSADGLTWANATEGSGLQTTTLRMRATPALHTRAYRCAVTNSLNRTVYSSAATLRVYAPASTVYQWVLPDSLQAARGESFALTGVTTVRCPQDMTIIHNRAFADCPSLELIDIPDSVTTISDSAFSGSPNVVIVCSPGSPAAQYAAEHGILWMERK